MKIDGCYKIEEQFHDNVVNLLEHPCFSDNHDQMPSNVAAEPTHASEGTSRPARLIAAFSILTLTALLSSYAVVYSISNSGFRTEVVDIWSTELMQISEVISKSSTYFTNQF